MKKSISQSKPNPEIFQKALDYFGYKKKEALILEDSENGYLAAKNSGIPYMIVPDASFEENFLSADKTYRNLFDVLGAIKEIYK